MNYKDETNYFKKALKEKRDNMNLSQYKAALCCGLTSHSFYGRLEATGNPTLKTLLKLSKGLDISIEIKNGKVFVLD
jgi:DNA-binding phage protein